MEQENKSNTEMRAGGIAFGTTSGIITTLGLIVGLDAATGSKLAIIAGILTIAIADSLSDSLGIHLSEEIRKDEAKKPIWTITFFTFLGKLLISSIFIIPFLLFSHQLAIILSVAMGIFGIVTLSNYIAKRKNESPTKVIIEHTVLMILVIIASYFVGSFVQKWQ